MSHKLATIVPEHIQLEKPELMKFMEAYYDFLQLPDQPGAFLKSLPAHRNLDTVGSEFLEMLQRELAVPIPENVAADKSKLYKNITDIYLSKGAEPSFKALFRLIFNDDIELFFPRVDILKPSDAKWDPANGRWKNDDGKLSVKKFIQDSRYYQSFSYVIKTGQTIDNWKDVVKKLLHPAGFAFFGEVTIFSEAVGAAGSIVKAKGVADFSTQDTGIPVFADPVVVDVSIPLVGGVALDIELTFILQPINQYAIGPTFLHVEKYKFLPDIGPISNYSNFTIADAVAGTKLNISFESVINIT
ncbi:MAG TPA: hypothetical protein DCM04_02445 [Saprospirales bacterium]|nr:hypothetical protein [Saprospirales bacterium]|tara:strand:- start:11108 stop:12010 length:903 start_codon:yes stop_codon:yes gene_type:complete